MSLLLALLGCAGLASPVMEGGTTLTLETRDGVDIVADYYPASNLDRPVVLLVHMNPSADYHRGDWPLEWLQALHAQDWGIMVPDRRGAGDSGGVAEDAYNSLGGAYDLEACTVWLADAGVSALSIVAASNGSTAMLDYTVLAPDQGWLQPRTLTWMSGVDTAENQNSFEDLPALPMHFVYPDHEAAWSEGWQELDPGTWQWDVYDGGGHGTKLFASDPQVSGDMVDFLALHLD